MTYTVKVPPGLRSLLQTAEAKGIVSWIEGELNTIAREFESECDLVWMRVQHVAPEKPRTGQLYYADGTDWNPGSGEGFYRYTIAGAWDFIG